MNIDTFLIICFVILLILIVISFVYFFGIYRRREISDSSAEPKAPEKPRQPEIMDIPLSQAPVQPAPQPQITVIRIRRREDNVVFNIDLSSGPVTLGRLSGCTDKDYCCVTSMSDVSKRHCTIRSSGSGRVLITDNDSTNHTYVNGRRSDGTASIGPGDVFSLGQHCEFVLL